MNNEKPLKKEDYIRIDNILNRKEGNLPFAYFSPDNTNVTWNCGYDAQQKIISIFSCNDGINDNDRKIQELPNLEEAIKYRDTLIDNGWQKVKPPEIVVKYNDGTEKPLSRKQKRFLAQKINKLSKNNPFDDEENNEK
jgi:hypothetical protein